MEKLKPLIFWEGLPVCSLLIKQVADEFGDDLKILATKPAVPFQDFSKLMGHEIIWLENPNEIWQRKEEFADRNFVVHTGWVHGGWLKFDRYLKSLHKTVVVAAVDNRFRGDLRQLLGALYFRLFLRRTLDAAIVPGKSGRKLMKFLGMPANRIYCPIYGAFEEIYSKTQPIKDRKNEFLFVGQLVERKGVDVLMNAFKAYRKYGGSWNLRMCGNGRLKDLCTGDGVILEDFKQPDEISEKMNHAKVLILPSRDDNWGTVVCEAAACGMHILSTKMAASSEDVLRNGENGFLLNKLSAASLIEAFFYFERLSKIQWEEGSSLSVQIAKAFDSSAYKKTFMKMIDDLA